MTQTNPNIKAEPLRVFLVDIVDKSTKKEILEDRMRELDNLVQTYGGVVILEKYQKKDRPDPKTYVGKGKLEEIIDDMLRMNANLLIVGNALKPAQIYQINEKLRQVSEEHGLKEKMQARDRIDLILKIFEKNATSGESRLQIELAAINHMGPRIYGMGMELSKQGGAASGGGAGATRGAGETNTEVMRRHLKEKIRKIEKKLIEYERMRKLHRDARKKKGMPTVGIVGYTNAGKSSLLNGLTKKGVLAENKLFATLGTNVGNMYVITDPVTGRGKEILLNDTIGFIRDLPPKLIKSFSSTLEDSIESEVLLHVIDASDPYIEERISVVHEILEEIGAHQPKILVFNKIDLIDEERLVQLQEMFADNEKVFTSVKDGIGLGELRQLLVRYV
ncbi:MAG: GTPase HflX [Candidatus Absconditabacteria bacterium]|nr:GTPase HflX [Candidatus Absconditabacteria bacterium]MDD3868555.1 GTPase HflX [Candidatus Absconditabacteria bacterium]MDD4714119.1 GTPase HflX [Candidatus Absconditabacteria bacterium]